MRRAMARIAREETRHASLSWEVARWAMTRLSSKDQAEVKTAMRRTQSALRHTLSQGEPASDLIVQAGLPDRASALRLLDQLNRRLWVV